MWSFMFYPPGIEKYVLDSIVMRGEEHEHLENISAPVKLFP